MPRRPFIRGKTRLSFLLLLPLLFLLASVSSPAAHPAQQSTPQPAPLTPYTSAAVAPHDTSSITTSEELPNLSIDEPPIRLPGPLAVQMSGENWPAAIDPMRDELTAPSEMPDLSVNIDGLSTDGSIIPPDPNGAVGPTHYVQIVNAATYGARVGIWEKANLTNPPIVFNLESLWPATDPCGSVGHGDPIVQYDQLANRWLLSQFAYVNRNGPTYECIAVSKTGVPTQNPADWYGYSFLVHPTLFTDYPKIGVWPDAYYMSANQFDFNAPEVSYAGVGVWAFDREAMLSGLPASFVYFNVGELDLDYYSLLPATLTGSTPPPAGAPNYFASVFKDWNGPGSDDLIHLFEFHVDWGDTAASSFLQVKSLKVNDFDWEINSFSYNSIPQPSPGTLLDDLADRLMMHLSYRNLGTHETLVANHTIDVNNAPPSVNGRAGIRWYEVRGGAVNGTFTDANIHQQSSLVGPNNNEHRWIGSAAVDRLGNLAMGYSVSGNNIFPGLRYAGRLVTDQVNVLGQGEKTIIAGGGAQTGSSRWGDYSSMSVDPVDGCTFWYTGEYINQTGPNTWRTRIAAFRFPNCQPVPDFSISASPQVHAVCAPTNAVFALEISDRNEFTGGVELSYSGAPDGVSGTFTPDFVFPPGNSVLNLTIGAQAPPGSYPLILSGTASGAQTVTRSTNVRLEVFNNEPTAPILTAPQNNATDIGLLPTFVWQAVPQARSYRLQIATTSTFSNLVVDAPGLRSTQYTLISELDHSQTYYWRVVAENACGEGVVPNIHIFSTIIEIGICPEGEYNWDLFSDEFASTRYGWFHDGINDTWTRVLDSPQLTGGFYASAESRSDQRLATPLISLPETLDDITLQFISAPLVVESNPAGGCLDGALLEISSDGGSRWSQIPGALLLSHPYDRQIAAGYGNPLAGKEAWCGMYIPEITTIVDLNTYAGKTVRFRFRLGSTDNSDYAYWFIKEVKVKGCSPTPQTDPRLFFPQMNKGVPNH